MRAEEGSPRPYFRDPRRPESLLLRVKAIPGASRTEGAGIRETADGPALLVRLAAAPEKGKANEELIAWLADFLDLPRSAIELRSGATGRLKTLALPSSAETALSALHS